MENLKHQIIQKGVEKVLDEAKVPYRYLLKIIQNLNENLAAHKKDIQTWDNIRQVHERQMSRHDVQIEKYQGLFSEHQQELSRIKAIPPEKGEPGKDANENAIFERLVPRIPQPKIDEEAIAVRAAALLPVPEKGDKGDDAILDEDKILDKLIERIQKGQVIDISHISNAKCFMKDGIRYQFEELMHGAGSTSGGSFSIIVVSGTIDDSNTVFTAPSQPTLLNINGAFYQKTGGAITWTYSGGNITLSSPVGVGGQIYGIA